MSDLPPRLTADDLAVRLSPDPERGTCVVTGRVAGITMFEGVPVVDRPQDAVGADLLIVVGGGMRIDAAKAWRAQNAPECGLIAVATRFGSGAEANGIAVLDNAGRKTIHIGPEYRPDARAYFPQMLETLGDDDIAWSCGDALTHAIEGFLSPLASNDLRKDLAGVIANMLALGVGRDAAWFELSAQASAGQAQASVGAVHGLAHVLESVCFQVKQGRNAPGHARLCAAFLAPVLRYNLAASPKAAARFAAYDVDVDALLGFADHLSGPALGAEIDWPAIITNHWKTILRDPCTRTNVALLRPGSLDALLAQLP